MKICKVHGELKKNDVYLAKNGTITDKKYVFCIACSKERRKIYYENNKDIVKNKQTEYTFKNKDKIKNYHKKYVEFLPDKYVARFFLKNSNLIFENIPKEILGLKRATILLKRGIKNE